MSVIGGRLLLGAVYVWAYQLFIYVHDGAWTEATWLDIMETVGLERTTQYLRGFEHAVLWVMGTPIGLELFIVGATVIWVGWWRESRRKLVRD